MSTQLFLRNLAGTPIVKPIGVANSWDGVSNTGAVGANALRLSTSSGPAQSNQQLTGINDARFHCLSQFISDTLAAQTINAANWTIAFALQSSVVFSNNAVIFISLTNGTTGALRSVMTALLTFGAAHVSTSELTSFSAIIGGATVVVQAGDYLTVECGITYNGVPTNATGQLWMGGVTAIAADNTVTADAQSFVTCPTTLTFGPDFGGAVNANEPNAYAFQQGLYIPIGPVL